MDRQASDPATAAIDEYLADIQRHNAERLARGEDLRAKRTVLSHEKVADEVPGLDVERTVFTNEYGHVFTSEHKTANDEFDSEITAEELEDRYDQVKRRSAEFTLAAARAHGLALGRREPHPPRRPATSPARPRGAGRPKARGAAKRSSARSGDSGEDGDPEPPPPGRPCAAPGCDRAVHGASQKVFCGTERCNRQRAADRQREHRTGDLTAAEREQLDDARRGGYVGEKAFAGPHEHALSFLWRFALVDGPDRGEFEALRDQRACRCNGHHIDGGSVGCFKCGLPRREAVASCS